MPTTTLVTREGFATGFVRSFPYGALLGLVYVPIYDKVQARYGGREVLSANFLTHDTSPSRSTAWQSRRSSDAADSRLASITQCLVERGECCL